MGKPTASLSLDLDNLWTYLKVHGDSHWVDYPTYIPRFIPSVLKLLAERKLRITFFVIGQDALQPINRDALKMIADAGHEIGNHALNHEPWMQNYPKDRVQSEIAGAEEAIFEATGYRTTGFRGPGYCRSANILEVLSERGYSYDTSMLPSVLGPLARLYYFRGAKLSKEKREDRSDLFGHVSDGFLPLKAFEWEGANRNLVEIPVTTIPVFRIPFHLSYLLWLSRRSIGFASMYLRFALAMCRLRGVEPCYLMHPLDFLGAEDLEDLAFFPGMDLSHDHKMEMVKRFLDAYTEHFDVVSVSEHARRIRAQGRVRIVAPATLDT